VIRLTVDHLPGDRHPTPVWLWCSDPGVSADDLDRLWQLFLRRFDLEHTFRFFKQTLGWTAPRLRSPEAADRWSWIVLVAYAQLRLARPLAEDYAARGNGLSPPARLTPARLVEGFRAPARRCPFRPVHRNPVDPDPDAHPDQKTPTTHRITTWANAPKPKRENPSGRLPRLKISSRGQPQDRTSPEGGA